MKTKDFIKMLQKEDPTGECHVRLGGGAPQCAERKPGYWDGPYQYFDKDGNLVISIKEEKIDVHSVDWEEFIWDHDGDYSKIKFEFDDYCEKEEQIQNYIEKFKKESEKCKNCDQQSLEHYTFRILRKLQDGWKVKEEKPNKKYMMNYVKGRKKDSMCYGACKAVHKTNLFESYDENEKSRFWRLKDGT